MPKHIRKSIPKAVNPHRKYRICLGEGCNRLFMSDGPGHRICPRCAESRMVVGRNCTPRKIVLSKI